MSALPNTEKCRENVRCCPERQENKRIREKQIQSESGTVSNSNDNQVSFELENFNEVWNWKSNSHRPQTKRRERHRIEDALQ